MATLYGYPEHLDYIVEEEVSNQTYSGNQFSKPRSYKSVCSSETINTPKEEDFFSYIINTIKDLLI